MRGLISGMIIAACVASTGTPVFAAEAMGTHDNNPPHIGGGHPHPGHGHHHDGHHRHRFLLAPFGYYESAPAPNVVVVNPDLSGSAAAPPEPPTSAADRPPCQETAAGGVVIFRGTGCTHDKR